MSKKTLSIVVGTAVAASLSSCSNLSLPDNNHPKVLPVPMYNPNPVPTGAHWMDGKYELQQKNADASHAGGNTSKIGPRPSGRAPGMWDILKRR